jgi:hypothetical protein
MENQGEIKTNVMMKQFHQRQNLTEFFRHNVERNLQMYLYLLLFCFMKPTNV